MTSTFEPPANDWRGDITVKWFQGGDMPNSPVDFVDLNKIGHGVMFRGKSGYLIGDFDKRMVYPHGAKTDMTYYKPRAEKDLIPPLGHFQQQ